jgi:hypothetical protein
MSPEVFKVFEEITSDLETEINGRYKPYGYLIHAALQRQYDRDMAPVLKAKEILERLKQEAKNAEQACSPASSEASSPSRS